MPHDNVFFQAFVYLLAAVITVPLAKRLGLGSVLGYLIAGVAIGPFVLGLVGGEGQDVMHFAEFGVVMMLFVIGLELQPTLLWRMRGPIFGMGGLQILLTALAGGGIAMAAGLHAKPAIAIGLILAMSSTAIVLQSLQEKKLIKTAGGEASFAVLLFQDVAVIPMIALLPLLATTGGTGHGTDTHAPGTNLPAWQHALVIIVVVAAIIVGGRFLLRPVLRYIARTGLREIFTATALLLVIGISLLVQLAGLSAALGTFLAGVVLAESEYRHELESDIEPFKGLLLGLFFISVGAGIDFRLISSQPATVALVTLALIAGKFAVLALVARIFRLPGRDGFLFATALAQGGEFCFVLLAFATGANVLPATLAGTLVAAVALSMALTPLLLLAFEKLLLPRLTSAAPQRPPDAVEEQGGRVIIAGFGRFGHIVGLLFRSCGVFPTVLDLDPDHVEMLRRLGLKVFFGDASRLELLHSAGARDARLLVVAVDDEESSIRIIETAQKHFPHLQIFARASGRPHAYRLLNLGVNRIYRETLDSSLELGADALRGLGFRAYEAQRAARVFRRQDEATVRELAKHWATGTDSYLAAARQRIRMSQEAIAADRDGFHHVADAGWDTESLRAEFGAPAGPETPGDADPLTP